MKKLMMLGILGIGLGIGIVALIIGCDNSTGTDGVTDSAGTEASSCPKGGGCYMERDGETYVWCKDSRCNVYTGEVDKGQTRINCNCDY